MATTKENIPLKGRLVTDPERLDHENGPKIRFRFVEEDYKRENGQLVRDDALAAELRAHGYALGLISMCSPDTPALWRSSPLAGSVDVEVFSCEVGMRKPDPEIYRWCVERLDVDSSRCLYVGDGAYGELTGAAALGMHAVLIRHPGEEDGVVLRPEAEPWDGRAIGSLPEVLELV